jgi:hypothetical protein
MISLKGCTFCWLTNGRSGTRVDWSSDCDDTRPNCSPFLDHPDVPSENNHAERQIRPAVIVRKNI